MRDGASFSVDDVNTSDQALIDRCLEGQTDAYGELVTRYQDRLYATLVSMLGSVHDARDATQDAFVLAFQTRLPLPMWLLLPVQLAAVYPHRKLQDPKVRLLLDFMAERCQRLIRDILKGG